MLYGVSPGRIATVCQTCDAVFVPAEQFSIVTWVLEKAALIAVGGVAGVAALRAATAPKPINVDKVEAARAAAAGGKSPKAAPLPAAPSPPSPGRPASPSRTMPPASAGGASPVQQQLDPQQPQQGSWPPPYRGYPPYGYGPEYDQAWDERQWQRRPGRGMGPPPGGRWPPGPGMEPSAQGPVQGPAAMPPRSGSPAYRGAQRTFPQVPGEEGDHSGSPGGEEGRPGDEYYGPWSGWPPGRYPPGPQQWWGPPQQPVDWYEGYGPYGPPPPGPYYGPYGPPPPGPYYGPYGPPPPAPYYDEYGQVPPRPLGAARGAVDGPRRGFQGMRSGTAARKGRNPWAKAEAEADADVDDSSTMASATARAASPSAQPGVFTRPASPTVPRRGSPGRGRSNWRTAAEADLQAPPPLPGPAPGLGSTPSPSQPPGWGVDIDGLDLDPQDRQALREMGLDAGTWTRGSAAAPADVQEVQEVDERLARLQAQIDALGLEEGQGQGAGGDGSPEGSPSGRGQGRKRIPVRDWRQQLQEETEGTQRRDWRLEEEAAPFQRRGSRGGQGDGEPAGGVPNGPAAGGASAASEADIDARREYDNLMKLWQQSREGEGITSDGDDAEAFTGRGSSTSGRGDRELQQDREQGRAAEAQQQQGLGQERQGRVGRDRRPRGDREAAGSQSTGQEEDDMPHPPPVIPHSTSRGRHDQSSDTSQGSAAPSSQRAAASEQQRQQSQKQGQADPGPIGWLSKGFRLLQGLTASSGGGSGADSRSTDRTQGSKEATQRADEFQQQQQQWQEQQWQEQQWQQQAEAAQAPAEAVEAEAVGGQRQSRQRRASWREEAEVELRAAQPQWQDERGQAQAELPQLPPAEEPVVAPRAPSPQRPGSPARGGNSSSTGGASQTVAHAEAAAPAEPPPALADMLRSEPVVQGAGAPNRESMQKLKDTSQAAATRAAETLARIRAMRAATTGQAGAGASPRVGGGRNANGNGNGSGSTNGAGGAGGSNGVVNGNGIVQAEGEDAPSGLRDAAETWRG